MDAGETSEQKVTVLPRAPFRRSFKGKKHAPFIPGQRVVLLSLTADGWISSGIHGTILSLSDEQDVLGRRVPKATVEWDGTSHRASYIGHTALSRLRHQQ